MDKQSRKETVAQLEKYHDLVIDGVVSLNRLNSSIKADLTPDEHQYLSEKIEKIKSSTNELKEFIDSLSQNKTN